MITKLANCNFIEVFLSFTSDESTVSFWYVSLGVIFIRNGEFNYKSNRVAVSGTTCRLAHLPRCMILEQSVGVEASNARCYRYCSFCCSFSFSLSFSILLTGPSRFLLLAVHTCDALFSFRAIGPTRGEWVDHCARSLDDSLHF